MSKKILLLTVACLGMTMSAQAAEIGVLSQRATKLAEISARVNMATPRPEGAEARVSSAYEALFGKVNIALDGKRLSRSDLIALFKAANIALNDTEDVEYLTQMESALAELVRRSGEAHYYLMVMHGTYIGLGMFEQAKAFEVKHALKIRDATPLTLDPGFDIGAITEWKLDKSSRQLMRREVVFPAGPFIVVTSSPNCHFAYDAMKELSKDRTVVNAMRGRVKWLTLLDDAFVFDDLQQWNNKKPFFEHTVTHRRKEWKMIGVWATPNFHFLVDGKLVGKLTGWHVGGTSKEKLVAEMKKIGFAFPDSPRESER